MSWTCGYLLMCIRLELTTTLRSFMGANETFLPSSLRPSRPSELTPASASKDMLPRSGRTQTSTSLRSRRRSKSLSEAVDAPRSGKPQPSPSKVPPSHYTAMTLTAYASPEKPIPSRGAPRPLSSYASPEKPIPSRGGVPSVFQARSPDKLLAMRTLATPSRIKPRVSVAPHTTGSRRVSLSAGALPLPTSASLKSVVLPSTSSRSRLSTIAQKDIPTISTANRPTSIQSNNGVQGPSRFTATATAVVRPNSIAAPSLSRPRSLVAGTGLGQPRTRVGSTPAVTTLPSLRPTHTTRPPTNSTAMPPPSSRMTRPSALPQPGISSTARSAPSQTRTFGVDAAATTNRLSRPTPSTTASRLTKQSAGPLPAPSKRTIETSSRAASTPASALVRPGLARPVKSGEVVKKSSTAVATGSTLPRPSTRLPIVGSGASKLSTGPTASSAGIASLRARLDQLQARQASARSGR
jgi:hypothetical protein